jgi:poly-beta-hydroxybutyrate-responsive repressor
MVSKKENFNKQIGYPEKRWLQFLILRTICEKPTYGYELIKSIENISNGKHIVKPGTMYTTLRRMEKEGIIKSTWEDNNSGPKSRVYKITKKGENYLKSWLEFVIERKKMIDKMVDFYKKYFGDRQK